MNSQQKQKSETLPFIVGRNFWKVQPTGDHRKDCETGRDYLLALTKALQEGRVTAETFQRVTAAMPKIENFSGIEAGFLTLWTRSIFQIEPAGSGPYDDALKIAAQLRDAGWE